MDCHISHKLNIRERTVDDGSERVGLKMTCSPEACYPGFFAGMRQC